MPSFANRHPPILALGYSEACMLLANPGAPTIAAVISISGSREHTVDAPNIERQLILHFDDAETIDFTDPAAAQRAWARQKWSAQMGRPLRPPTKSDALAIIEFARALREAEGTVLCHCQAGVSRSTAAALICLATWSEPGDERRCMADVLQIRPCASPLLDLVRFADVLLSRDGQLAAAVTDARR